MLISPETFDGVMFYVGLCLVTIAVGLVAYKDYQQRVARKRQEKVKRRLKKTQREIHLRDFTSY